MFIRSTIVTLPPVPSAYERINQDEYFSEWQEVSIFLLPSVQLREVDTKCLQGNTDGPKSASTRKWILTFDRDDRDADTFVSRTFSD